MVNNRFNEKSINSPFKKSSKNQEQTKAKHKPDWHQSKNSRQKLKTGRRNNMDNLYVFFSVCIIVPKRFLLFLWLPIPRLICRF